VRIARGPGAVVDERGVTLVDIVAAVAIISIGLVGLAIVIPVASHGVQEGGQLSTATFLAEQMIERARAARWSADPAMDCLGLSAGDSAPIPEEAACHGSMRTQFPDEAGGISGHPEYERRVRVTDCRVAPGCADVSSAGIRRVTVSVGYTPRVLAGSHSTLRTVQLEWMVSRK
jgi:hypothetical protein